MHPRRRRCDAPIAPLLQPLPPPRVGSQASRAQPVATTETTMLRASTRSASTFPPAPRRRSTWVLLRLREKRVPPCPRQTPAAMRMRMRTTRLLAERQFAVAVAIAVQEHQLRTAQLASCLRTCLRAHRSLVPTAAPKTKSKQKPSASVIFLLSTCSAMHASFPRRNHLGISRKATETSTRFCALGQ